MKRIRYVIYNMVFFTSLSFGLSSCGFFNVNNFESLLNSTQPNTSIEFGTNGIVKTNVSLEELSDDHPKGVQVLSDGKILTAGVTIAHGDKRVYLTRTNTDGSIDTTFGSEGIIAFDNPNGVRMTPVNMKVVADKIYIAGVAQGSTSDFFIMRLSMNGTLDESFGNDGLVISDLSGGSDDTTDMDIGIDGKVVVLGRSDNGNDFDFELARYNTDGSLDTTFNSTGFLNQDFNAAGDFPVAVRIQSDGKILVASHSYAGIKPLTLFRYNVDGSLDTTFNTTGVVNDGDFSEIDALYIQNDGMILVGGVSTSYQFSIARFTSSGAFDTGFNATGALVIDTSASGSSFEFHSFQEQSDGKILCIGDITPSSARVLAVIRLSSTGALDTAYGNSGVALFDITGFDSTVVKADLQGDGKLIVAIDSYDSNIGKAETALARIGTSGSPDTSFSTNGAAFPQNVRIPSADYIMALAEQADGKIIAIGSTESSDNKDFSILRYTAAGVLDTSFGTTGKVSTDINGDDDRATAVTVLSDGKILVGGDSWGMGGYSYALVRYNNNGSLDTTFNGTGKVTGTFGTGSSQINSIIFLSNGKILVLGSFDPGSGDLAAVACLNSDGTLDTNFNTTGILTWDFGGTYNRAVKAVEQSDGKIIVVGGLNSNSSGSADIAMTKINTNGSIDTNYGTGGFTITDAVSSSWDTAYDIVLRGGKALVAATVDDGTASQITLLQYDSTGALDTSFNSNGISQVSLPFTAEPISLLLQSDGKIMMGVYGGPSSNKFTALRLSSSGVLDTTFNITGYKNVGFGSGRSNYLGKAILLNSGDILLGGSTDQDGSNDYLLIRIKSDGTM